MFFVVLSGFVLAFIAPGLYSYSKRLTAFVFPLYPLLVFIYLLFLSKSSLTAPVIEIHHWVPLLQIHLSFYADGLSLLFSLVIAAIGFLVLTYSGEYMKRDPSAGRYYLFLLMFMSSMLGLVLAGNVICMFIFWELTSISSFFLIGHKHQEEKSRKSALQALLITGGGGLFLLIGLIILGQVAGTFEFHEMMQSSDIIRSHASYVSIVLLIALGAFTKSAQFPFHFWLPNAMSAPTPVSAYLHSATMVKAGVFLFARMTPLLGETALWNNLLLWGGAITMLTGAIFSVFQTDLKKILAYSTVSSLGTLVLLIGIGGEFAITAAIVYFIVYTLYKGGLFLMAGTIDYQTGTRDVSILGGLFRFMPLIALAGIFAALSNAGIPPLFGFIGKELLYEAVLQIGAGANIVIGLVIVSNILLVVAALNAGVKPFIGFNIILPKVPGNVPFALWFPPVLLSLAGLIAGLFPQLFVNRLVSQSVSVVINQPVNVKLELWHGFNLVLFLSILTIIGGIALYFIRLYRLEKKVYSYTIIKAGPESWYNYCWESLLKFAWLQSKVLQNGYLRFYLLAILVTLLFFLLLTITTHVVPFFDFLYKDLRIYEALLAVTLIVAAVLVASAKSRLIAVASLGLAGYGLSLIFVLFGAPDIAMTQFTIDTLTVILFVLILYKLPHFSTMSSITSRVRDLSASVLAGGILTFLILYVIVKPSDPGLRSFFAENSYLIAKGRNVVNVILVDFRSLDTLVEIAVLAVAAIGVYALLKLKLPEKKT